MKGLMIEGKTSQDTDERYEAMCALNALSTLAIKNLVYVSEHPKAINVIENKAVKLRKLLDLPLI